MIRFLDTSLSVSLRDSEYTSKDQFCRCVRPHLTNPLWLPQVLNQGHQCTCFSHVRAGALTYTSPHPFDTLVTGMNQPTVPPPLAPPPLAHPSCGKQSQLSHLNFLIFYPNLFSHQFCDHPPNSIFLRFTFLGRIEVQCKQCINPVYIKPLHRNKIVFEFLIF